MSKWEFAVVTEDGLSLQSKLGAGSTMVFTKVKTGAGSVPVVLLQKQTDIENPKQVVLFGDNPYYLTEPGAAELSFIITNDDVYEGYSCYQIGVYAEDPDKGEILYAILQTANPVAIPSHEQNAGWGAEFNVALQYGNAENVSVYVNASGVMSRQIADKRYMKKVVYQGVLHELVWDETGVWLKEVEEENSGEVVEVPSISDADMEKLKTMFVDEDKLDTAMEAAMEAAMEEKFGEEGKLPVQFGGLYTNDETTEEDKAEAKEALVDLGFFLLDCSVPMSGKVLKLASDQSSITTDKNESTSWISTSVRNPNNVDNTQIHVRHHFNGLANDQCLLRTQYNGVNKDYNLFGEHNVTKGTTDIGAGSAMTSLLHLVYEE